MNDLALLLPPLAAGLLALASHLPLGRQVLRRGIVFIDLAIAQVAGLGVLAAALALHDAPPLATALAAAGAALAGAGAVALLGRWWPARHEALIGLLYVGAASLAVLLVSHDPHGAHKLAALLSGDVLWATWPALLPLLAATVLFLLAWRARPALLEGAAFYPAFALLVSLTLPLLGLYLVFATLIVPALVAAQACARGLRAGAAAGLAGYVLGLLASWRWDLPSGPAVVLALVACGAAALLLAARGRAAGSPDNGP
ncbi:metal ABC transporter permease [Ottowia sp.]|jgi:zinc/manganese transport system permease protein|uniref:metal ABC transporter permease n=1 Tax=Ottowia sp. TaxID=1898956 RepID=UPI0025D84616|nr:metal ABC transporter permease [Ottowia sp.]MBK6614711.1 metal ABC transporter permease [Ottowia sp.]MBK6745797.1 metal ABC transporter permease [Ottowia sp.]